MFKGWEHVPWVWTLWFRWSWTTPSSKLTFHNFSTSKPCLVRQIIWAWQADNFTILYNQLPPFSRVTSPVRKIRVPPQGLHSARQHGSALRQTPTRKVRSVIGIPNQGGKIALTYFGLEIFRDNWRGTLGFQVVCTVPRVIQRNQRNYLWLPSGKPSTRGIPSFEHRDVGDFLSMFQREVWWSTG